MTYCIGYWLEKGLVLASDSRTNAGVDYISTYSKMYIFQPAPDRLFVLLAAGSLATTQAVVNWIRRDLDRPADLNVGAPQDLRHCDYLFEAAAYVGRVSVAAQKENEEALRQSGASGGSTFLLGGQIGSEPHGLYLIYPQGNAIQATPETPYLQIGESKYGKPPLDNIGHSNLSLEDATHLCLISQVLTQRSNLSVGPPFELVVIEAGQHLLQEQGSIWFEPEATTTLYTRQCSLSVTTHDLALMAATLANGGRHPLSGEQVVAPRICQVVLAVMVTAGLYETSGDWIVDIGLPGKSGVSGGMITVAPGKGGLATYSPPLDRSGNSVRGQLAAAYLSERLGLNLFASTPVAP